MKVKFVGKSSTIVKTDATPDGQSRELTPEELIVYLARVSNPGNQLNMATADRLLWHCMREGHWSVFDMADMTLEIHTSRAIAAQLLRHRSMAFQEHSQRYAEAHDSESIELRRPAASNRQSSVEVINDANLDSMVTHAVTTSFKAYADLLKNGVARECARGVLPLSTTTRLFVKASIRSWVHYILVRDDAHAQKEHREVAHAALVILKEHFPVIGGIVEKAQHARQKARQFGELLLAFRKGERTRDDLVSFVSDHGDAIVMATQI